MLTPNQQKYLLTIPEDKVAVIKPFDPKVQETAHKIIQRIKNESPDLEVFFGGASALGIAGQNDIDLSVLSNLEFFNSELPILRRLFGKPNATSQNLVKWEFKQDGFDVELYLSDRDSASLQEQIKTYELLRDNLAYQKEYEQIKLACNGLPFREYMRRKYEFFNKILGI
jgi:GrpB-like predicted nucleotidyltransferase (UPF0157 family)